MSVQTAGLAVSSALLVVLLAWLLRAKLEVLSVNFEDLTLPLDTHARPMLIRRSPADQWLAHERWANFSYLLELASTTPSKVHVKSSKERVFAVGSSPVLQADLKKFLVAASSKLHGSFYYLSMSLEKLGPSWLRDLGDDLSWAEVGGVNESKEAAQYGSSANIWIGSEGATTPLHNDHFHNIYCQVVGRRKVSLLPSSSWREVYPHSKLSVRFRQSQLRLPFEEEELSATAQESFPKFADLRPIVVVLNPGDVLYIPPLWFHQVEALSPGIAVNIWSKDEAIEGMQPNLAVSLEPKELLLSTFPVVAALAARTLGAADFPKVSELEAMKILVRQHLQAKIWPRFNGTDPSKCEDCDPQDPHVVLHEREQKMLTDHDFLSLSAALSACREVLAGLDGNRQDDTIQNSTIEFLLPNYLKPPPELAMYMLGNMLEDLSAEIVESRHVPQLWKYCFLDS